MRLGRNATIAISVAAVALLAVLVTLLVARPDPASAPSGPSIALPSVPELNLPSPQLLLPEENERLLSHRFRPFREPRGSWSDEDVAGFWNDPQEVTADYFREKGRAAVEAMLEEVP